MKKIPILLLAILVSACSKQDDDSPPTYSSESTIYSSTKQSVLRELMLMIKPYTIHENTKEYIVVPSVNNIKVLINGKEWGLFSSSELDVSQINKDVANDFNVKTTPVKYVVRAPYLSSTTILTTAGEYSDLLDRYISLQPGGYVCQIEYFELTDNNGNIHRIFPLIAEYFEVKENTVSAFIGEFEILID